MAQHQLGELVLLGRMAQAAQKHRRAALLHLDGRGVYIQRTCFQQQLANVTDGLTGHIIQIAAKLHDLILFRLLLLGVSAPEYPQHVSSFKILAAHADAHLLGDHDRHGAEGLCKGLKQSRSGGGAQLAPDGAGVGGNPLQNVSRGGGGHRQDAVGAAHLTAAQMHRAGNDFFRRKDMQQQADGSHIRHRVQRAHLMEVNLIHRAAVGCTFRLGDGAVDLQRLLLHLRGQTGFLNGMLHPGHGGVMMMPVTMFVLVGMVMAVLVHMVMRMFVLVRVAVLLFPVYQHMHMQALHTAFLRRMNLHLHPRQQLIHLLQKSLLLLRAQQIQQRSGEHIARRAHGTFDV